jgi:hypothetical protein
MAIAQSKTQLFMEFIVVMILAGIIIFGPEVIGMYVPVNDNVIQGLTIVLTYVAYEFLSPEGLALFKEILGQLKSTGSSGNDKGELGLVGYMFVGIVVLVAAVAMLGIVYYGVDGFTLLLGAIGATVLGFFGLAAKDASKIYKGVTVRYGLAYIDWALFDKSMVKVQAVPEGLLHITFTANGHTWDAEDCRYNPKDGYIYSIRADPTADNDEGMKNDVYLAMDKLSAPAALDFILEKIAAKGKADVTRIKTVLVLGEAKAGAMSAKDYADYVNGLNPEVNLDKGWEALKKRDEYFLRRIADDLYYKYYK